MIVCAVSIAPRASTRRMTRSSSGAVTELMCCAPIHGKTLFSIRSSVRVAWVGVARFLALFASLGEADLGIDAQAQQLFLAAEPELVAPPLRAAGLHLEVHAAAVEHANRAIAGLRTLDRDRGQLVGRHGGGSTSVRMSITPVIYPHLPSDSSPRAWTQWDDISAVYLVYRGRM